jgi:hypothetical protein
MAKPFDYEHEQSEAKKFRALASAFEQNDTMGLSERFSILAALCEEKCKVLRELVEDVVFEGPQSKARVIEWPSIAEPSKSNRFGKN